MKTIKTLLKELMGKDLESPVDGSNKTINPKNSDHETETDENPGDYCVADPDSTRPVEEPQGDTTPEGELNSQEETISEGDDTSLEGNVENIDELLLEAYERGVKDGRNAAIEETHFPKVDDGVPHFRGNAVPNTPMGDIFSMAREA